MFAIIKRWFSLLIDKKRYLEYMEWGNNKGSIFWSTFKKQFEARENVVNKILWTEEVQINNIFLFLFITITCRLSFCAHHFCPKRKISVRLSLSSIPCLDKCHETSQIFPWTVIFSSCFLEGTFGRFPGNWYIAKEKNSSKNNPLRWNL